MTAIQDRLPLQQPAAIYGNPLIRALDKPLKSVHAGPIYQIGLLLVLFMMLLLPLVYLSLVVGVGYLVYLHATLDTFILGGHGRAGLGRLVLYLAPIVGGGILILFMIKPLFVRRRIISTPLTVTEQEQPLLYAFVYRLADVVHAPRPRRIDIDCQVNASASFEGGLLAMVRRDLVLTVGLPLVSGLSARQFTGVLAHELGHFAQGGGMRLTYLIRRLNMWFARIVYERDAWDEALRAAMHTSSHWAIHLVALLAMCFVAVSRLILKFLMIVAHGVSSFMLRQMEYDADRCATRVTGIEDFVETTNTLPMLMIASQAAFSDLSNAWRERRLADDLPLLIQSRQREIPADARVNLIKKVREKKTGWFDTHPCDSDRIKSVRREKSPGKYPVDAPAASLFKDYDDLSRRATVALYHEQLRGEVKRENLVPTSSLVEKRGKARQSYEALQRYFQGLVHPIRPVFLEGNVTSVADRDAAAELLLDLRTQFTAGAEEATHAAMAFEEADERLAVVARVRSIRSGGAKKIDLVQFKLAKGDDEELFALNRQSKSRCEQATQTLSTVLAIGMQRLELALALEREPAKASELESDDDYGEYSLTHTPTTGSSDLLCDALRTLRGAALHVEELRQQFYSLGALLSQCKPEKNSEQLIGAVLAVARRTMTTMTRIQSKLRAAPYPYEHASESVTISQYIVSAVPAPEAVSQLYHAAESVLDGSYSLYMRVLSDLCERAEAVEESLGLPPLPGAATLGE